MLTRTTAIGYYHQNLVGLCQRLTDHRADVPAGMPRERLWKVRAKQVVLAQGAIEKPLVFAGNDRPGVMLAGAARTYLNRYGVRVGERAVVVTAHDTAWTAAFDLARAGTTVAMIVDMRRTVDDRLLAAGPEPRHRDPVRRHRHGYEGAAAGLGRSGQPRRALGQGGCRTLDRLRCAPDVGRLDAQPAPLLAYRRQARLG